MIAATTETLEQEYDRLLEERHQIGAAVRAAGTPTPELEARYQTIMGRLREILATPPAGYTLPKPAADLLTHAEAAGWQTQVQWTPPGWTDEVFAKIGFRRELTDTEKEAADYYRSGAWLYELTYHSRGCPAGKLKRFGAGRGRTPDMASAEHQPAPSLKAIRAVISDNPAPDAPPAALF